MVQSTPEEENMTKLFEEETEEDDTESDDEEAYEDEYGNRDGESDVEPFAGMSLEEIQKQLRNFSHSPEPTKAEIALWKDTKRTAGISNDDTPANPYDSLRQIEEDAKAILEQVKRWKRDDTCTSLPPTTYLKGTATILSGLAKRMKDPKLDRYPEAFAIDIASHVDSQMKSDLLLQDAVDLTTFEEDHISEQSAPWYIRGPKIDVNVAADFQDILRQTDVTLQAFKEDTAVADAVHNLYVRQHFSKEVSNPTVLFPSLTSIARRCWNPRDLGNPPRV